MSGKQRVIKEKDIILPDVTMDDDKDDAVLPSLSDEGIWHFAGERGCFSDSPECLKYCFRDLVHRNGILMYRMKPFDEYDFKLEREHNKGNMFAGVMIHDLMECFTPLEVVPEHSRDNLELMKTHSKDGKAYDVMEGWCSVPYDRFSKYLDPSTPMKGFLEEVEAYFEEQRKLKRRKIDEEERE